MLIEDDWDQGLEACVLPVGSEPPAARRRGPADAQAAAPAGDKPEQTGIRDGQTGGPALPGHLA